MACPFLPETRATHARRNRGTWRWLRPRNGPAGSAPYLIYLRAFQTARFCLHPLEHEVTRLQPLTSATSVLRSCLGTCMGAFSALLLFCHQPVRGVPQLAGWIEAEYSPYAAACSPDFHGAASSGEKARYRPPDAAGQLLGRQGPAGSFHRTTARYARLLKSKAITPALWGR